MTHHDKVKTTFAFAKGDPGVAVKLAAILAGPDVGLGTKLTFRTYFNGELRSVTVQDVDSGGS